MDRIEVDGATIAFERAGSGPPLVLLHGGFSDDRVWRRQLEGLADAFTVVAWDTPGCGQSSDPPASFRLPGYADQLARFIHALDLGRPHVLGLSFGGGLALELYRRHPELPRTLLLASAYAGWAGSLPPEDVEARLRRALRGFSEADLRGILPHIEVPTLLLYGDRDVRSPLPVARELHDHIPTSELVVLPGVGHSGNLEAPLAFNSAVRTFLTRA